MFAATLLSSALALCPQEPLRIGVIAEEDRASADVAYVRGVRQAVDAINKAGGVGGAKLELVMASARTAKAVAAAVKELREGAIHGLVAPPELHLGAAVDKAAGGELPVLRYGVADSEVIEVLDRLLERHLCMTKIGLVRGTKRPSREFGKALAAGLSAPVTVLWEVDTRTSPKKFAKLIESDRPEIVVFEADAAATAEFLAEKMPDDALPVVLTPRAYGADLLAQKRTVLVIHGLSPAQTATSSQFRADYERSFGVPGLGAAEGYESVTALARAFESAGSRDPAAVTKALAEVAIEGVRGRIAYDGDLGSFRAPLGVWIVEEGRAVPYSPLVVPLGQAGTAAEGETAEPRKPQAGIGVPFGTWRTRDFAWEEGSQYVLCMWADDGGYRTIDDDLKQLGLSTGGAAPIVDHLVKEEIMARVIAITSTKFGRNEDGTAIPGKSLRICFGMHIDPKERKKKRQRLWPARFGGDHEGAGGEAFGTFCRVYSSFIRRTIFQRNALAMPVSAADRKYLDGTYVFGTDYGLDARSELIRALINGYAGSMALTLAHEVGHLGSLGHVTGDPLAIMNVEEGAGLDYPEARFCESSWQILEGKLGIVGKTSGKTKRRR